MSMENVKPDSETVEPMKTEIEGLNDVYRDIASEIGIENTLAFFRLFHGTQVSFPNRLFSREYTYRAILGEYDGDNVPQLAQKYNYSERSIWRILKSVQSEKMEEEK